MAKQNKEKEPSKIVDLSIDNLKEFEAGQGIDVTEYEGRATKIAGYEFREVTSDYTEDGEFVEGLGRKKLVLRVYSEPVMEYENEAGDKIAIKASEIFNLKQVDGEWGVSTSDNAKINQFLKKLKLPIGVDGLRQLVGKKVIMKATGKNGNFLGFVY